MTKILNHINTYADLTAYDNDNDKNYPNIAYIQETNEVKWEKVKPYFIVCNYNVTSTSEATILLGSSNTGITYQIIDDVKQDTVKSTYTFDTLGEHTVKYNLDGTSIKDSAFSSCTGLTSVTIPNSVTSIDAGAFYNCTGLTSVEIPNSVTEIGSGAFSNCTGLTSVTIPNSVTSIDSGAFSDTAWYNNQLDGLVYAGKVAYKYKGTMPSGTSIVLKEETKGIASNAFENCGGLTNITIPNSVTSIGRATFYNCTGLTSVNIPNSVTEIGDLVFLGCSSLTSIVIPDSITSISTEAFSGCSSLTSIVIPKSVISIWDDLFKACSSLESIVVDSANTVFDSRENCNAIIHTSTNKLISGCKNTVIPNTVTSISDYAFSGYTGLTSVEIPNSVTEIGSSTFRDCTGLTSVTIKATTPPTLSESMFGGYAFDNTNDCPIYVPAESVDKYKKARIWRTYRSRINSIPTE